MPALKEIPAPTRGSGQVACCGGHRARCLFGHMHSWGTWYVDGQLQRTSVTFYCHSCGGVCTAEEADLEYENNESSERHRVNCPDCGSYTDTCEQGVLIVVVSHRNPARWPDWCKGSDFPVIRIDTSPAALHRGQP